MIRKKNGVQVVERQRNEAQSGQCPLCATSSLQKKSHANGNSYFLCPCCGLTHLEPASFVPFEDEAAHYLTHENSISNKGYVDFLNQVIEPLTGFLCPGAVGLDYGCGPILEEQGPVAAQLLKRLGYDVSVYDPHFASNDEVLDSEYDFVLCTEVIEHFQNPAEEFPKMLRAIRPGGYLGLMTLVLGEDIDFHHWWYPRDPTHCSFYALQTMRWLADRYSLRLLFSDSKRVFCFQKV